MAETPNPTITQYRAMANKATGRVSVALAELKRRLWRNLPALIDDYNTQLGFDTPDVQIRSPEFIHAGPVGETQGLLNGILLAASAQTEFEGNGQFKNEYSISIYSVDERIETEAQYHRHWDRTELIRVALFPFLSGCIDTANRVCWRSLVPMQSGVEMADWEQYAGFYVFYRMTCDPSQNTWS